MRAPLVFTLLLGVSVLAYADLTEEQRRVPIEVDSPNPKSSKIILLAGKPSNKPGQHEYFAGCALLMEWLKQTPGTWPVLVAEDWPKNEEVFDGAKAIVVYADGGAKLPFLDPGRWAKLKGLIDAGAGFVVLHQAVDVPQDRAAEIKDWLGAVWQPDIGCRGHWDMEFSAFSDHPVNRGVTPFAAPLDGWLYNLHFAPGAIPLLKGAVPDKSRTTADARANMSREEVIGWAYERANGGRSFAFTGCDLHRNWSVESQRKFVVNGILWTAKIEVPATGASTAMAAGALTLNLDAKITPPPKRPQ